MGTTQKRTPRQIAQDVIKSQGYDLRADGDIVEDDIETAIMLGIAAYADASNQRPETLSEAAMRLGVNVKHSSSRTEGVYWVFFGLDTALSLHLKEADVIAEIEELVTRYPAVNTWVETGL